LPQPSFDLAKEMREHWGTSNIQVASQATANSLKVPESSKKRVLRPVTTGAEYVKGSGRKL